VACSSGGASAHALFSCLTTSPAWGQCFLEFRQVHCFFRAYLCLTSTQGYYPAGVQGVGGNAVMFVLSTEDWFGGTWYMLNQVSCTFHFSESLNHSAPHQLSLSLSDHLRQRPKFSISSFSVLFIHQRQLLGIRQRCLTNHSTHGARSTTPMFLC
jgi:hypothetical protein